MQNQKSKLIEHLVSEGVLKTDNVIKAFKNIRREDFVLPEHKLRSYDDTPLPLHAGQTISQPYTVAMMTQALEPEEGQRILEVGAGSGYQAAILSEVTGKEGMIITIERVLELFEFALKNLDQFKNVIVVKGDGAEGYSKYAPYDRIIVTASAKKVPPKLLEQLKPGGILILPLGDEMTKIRKTYNDKITKEFLGYYSFVPLVRK